MGANVKVSKKALLNVYFEIGDYHSTGLLLGRGAFADVYKGYRRSTRDDVAIKVVNKRQLGALGSKYLADEIKVMQRLGAVGHPNVLRLYDVYADDNYIYLVLEYASAGDLKSYAAQQPSRRLDETTARHFARQLGAGLEFLDEHDVVHRDLKPQNLLLADAGGDDALPVLKIADFGFARTLEQSRALMTSVLGSPLYMSPELLREEAYDKKSDVWSVGVILFELLYGRAPWTGVASVEQLKQAHRRAIAWPRTPALSRYCRQLLEQLLQPDRSLRLTLAELFRHKWLRGCASVRVRVVVTADRARARSAIGRVDVPLANAHGRDLRAAIADRYGVPAAAQLLLVVVAGGDAGAGPAAVPTVRALDDDTPLADVDGLFEPRLDGNSAEFDDDRMMAAMGASVAVHAGAAAAAAAAAAAGAAMAHAGCVYVYDARTLLARSGGDAASPPPPAAGAFAFAPVPIDDGGDGDGTAGAGAGASASAGEHGVDAELAPLLQFQRAFALNYRRERALKAACQHALAQCTLAINQLDVHGDAVRVLAEHVGARAAAARAALAPSLAAYDAGAGSADERARARARPDELRALADARVDAALAAATGGDGDGGGGGGGDDDSLLARCAPPTLRRDVARLAELGTALDAHFAAVRALDADVERLVPQARRDAPAVTLAPLREQLDRARHLASQVRTYAQVFERHYRTVEARVDKKRAQLEQRKQQQQQQQQSNGDDDNPLGWSLVAEGFEEMGSIHADEVAASRRHLARLNGFLEELTTRTRQSSDAVRPTLARLARLAARVDALAAPDARATLDAQLAEHAALRVRVDAPLRHAADAYHAAVAEVVRRQRYDARVRGMVTSVRATFDAVYQQELEARRAFAATPLAAHVAAPLFPGLVDGAAGPIAVRIDDAPRTLDAALAAVAPPADDIEAGEGFENIEASVLPAHSGHVRQLRLEAENRRLRERERERERDATSSTAAAASASAVGGGSDSADDAAAAALLEAARADAKQQRERADAMASELAALRAELDRLRRDNDELRDLNGELTDAVFAYRQQMEGR